MSSNCSAGEQKGYFLRVINLYRDPKILYLSTIHTIATLILANNVEGLINRPCISRQSLYTVTASIFYNHNFLCTQLFTKRV